VISFSIMAATLVIGIVAEAIQKIGSMQRDPSGAVTKAYCAQIGNLAVVGDRRHGAREGTGIDLRLLPSADAHQFCLAHLIRDAQYAIDDGDAVFAPAFKAFLQRACGIGRRRPDLADSTIKRYAQTLERELDRLLDLEPVNAEGRHLRDAIIVDARDKLLVFLTRRDVEPTNNGSERALRPSVIYRKVTNGFRSDWGAKVYADLCSIVTTGHLHGRSPLAAIRAALTGRSEPATT
jgi:Transposase IS66 family